MKLMNVNFEDFMQVIDKCTGPVWLVTADRDRLNLKSKLSQLIGIREMIRFGDVEVMDIECDNMEDRSKIFRFILYREI